MISSAPEQQRWSSVRGFVQARMHELAFGVTTISPRLGPVLNPHNNVMHVGGEERLLRNLAVLRLAV